MAEMERFELSRVLTPLPLFESGPFNHLGTSPFIFSRSLGRKSDILVVWITVSILLALARKKSPDKPCKALNRAGLRERGGEMTVGISSQPRYDHFDTPPYENYSIFKVYDRCIARHLRMMWSAAADLIRIPYFWGKVNGKRGTKGETGPFLWALRRISRALPLCAGEICDRIGGKK